MCPHKSLLPVLSRSMTPGSRHPGALDHGHAQMERADRQQLRPIIYIICGQSGSTFIEHDDKERGRVAVQRAEHSEGSRFRSRRETRARSASVSPSMLQAPVMIRPSASQCGFLWKYSSGVHRVTAPQRRVGRYFSESENSPLVRCCAGKAVGCRVSLSTGAQSRNLCRVRVREVHGWRRER
jgi:hypothetical protein